MKPKTTKSQTDLERLLAGFEEISQAMLESLDLEKVLDTLAIQIVETGIFRSLMIALVDEKEEILQELRSVVCILDDEGNTISSRVCKTSGNMRPKHRYKATPLSI